MGMKGEEDAGGDSERVRGKDERKVVSACVCVCESE